MNASTNDSTVVSSAEFTRGTGHSIARMEEPGGALAPLQLEERRLIHREEAAEPAEVRACRLR